MRPDQAVSRSALAAELEELYRTRGHSLAARISMNGRTDDGLDVLHEAFARALGRDAHRHPAIDCAEAFVSRISRNLLADRARRRTSEEQWAADCTARAQVGNDPVVALESRDALRRIEAALLKLRPVTRDVFLARRVEGLTYAEIAQRTGLSTKAVEKRMAKAIAKLSRLMDRC